MTRGQRAAKAVGWVLVVGLTYVVVSGLLLNGFVSLMNKAYSVRDTTTAEGVHKPATSLRSGGSGSLHPRTSAISLLSSSRCTGPPPT